jgi:hypothetical protein
MATQLTIVNNVLRRLREDTVSSVADSAYAKLIATFVNDGIDEVVSAFQWTALEHTINVAIASGTRVYDLSATVAQGGNVDNSDSPTNERSMLLWDRYNRAQAWIFDSSSDTQYNNRMYYIPPEELEELYQLDRDQAQEDAFYFTLTMNSDGDGYSMTVWPEPNATRHVRIRFWTPQDDLAVDGTDDSTNVRVPRKPVEAYATMRAANERGEEIGEPGNLLEQAFYKSLGESIEPQIHNDMRANLYESWRD